MAPFAQLAVSSRAPPASDLTGTQHPALDARTGYYSSSIYQPSCPPTPSRPHHHQPAQACSDPLVYALPNPRRPPAVPHTPKPPPLPLPTTAAPPRPRPLCSRALRHCTASNLPAASSLLNTTSAPGHAHTRRALHIHTVHKPYEHTNRYHAWGHGVPSGRDAHAKVQCMLVRATGSATPGTWPAVSSPSCLDPWVT